MASALKCKREFFTRAPACGWPRPCGEASLAAKCVAHSSIISPAPTNSTRMSLQILEELPGQAHRRRRHADRMGADLGGSAHFLGHGEGALEELVQGGAQRAGGVGLAHGLLELAQDLGLAQHHGIQPAGHPEGVPRGVAAFAHVGVVCAAARRRRHPSGPASRWPVPATGAVRRSTARCGCRWRGWPPRAQANCALRHRSGGPGRSAAWGRAAPA